MSQQQTSVMHLGRLDPEVGRLMPFMPALAGRLAEGPLAAAERPDLPLDLLLATGLLQAEDGHLVPGPNLVIFEPDTVRYLTESIRSSVEQALEVLRETGLRLLSAACARTEGWDWERDCHTVAAGLLMDLALAGALHRGGYIPGRPRSFWIWAFLGGTQTRHRVGTVISGSPDLPTGAGQLWAGSPPARRLSLNRAAVAHLHTVIAGGPEGADPAARMLLQYHGLLRTEGARLVPRVPVLRCAPGEPLWDAVEARADELAATLGPALSVADRLLGQNGIAELGAARHAAFRFVLDHLVDGAITGGLLPPLPAERPADWGVWIWTEEPALRPFTSSRSAFHAAPAQGDGTT